MDELPQEEKALVVRMLMDYGYTPIPGHELVYKYDLTYEILNRWHSLGLISGGHKLTYTLLEEGLKKLGEIG